MTNIQKEVFKEMDKQNAREVGKLMHDYHHQEELYCVAHSEYVGWLDSPDELER